MNWASHHKDKGIKELIRPSSVLMDSSPAYASSFFVPLDPSLSSYYLLVFDVMDPV
jgi:hypothetical protein